MSIDKASRQLLGPRRKPVERNSTGSIVKASVFAVPHSTSGKGDRRMAHEQVQALLRNAKRLRMRLDKASNDPVRQRKLHAMLEDTLAKVSIIGSAHYAG